jgi:hypothetical protein
MQTIGMIFTKQILPLKNETPLPIPHSDSDGSCP